MRRIEAVIASLFWLAAFVAIVIAVVLWVH
jgi:hypothetical protein